MFELKQVSRKLGSLSSHPTGSPKINRVFLPEGHEYEGGTSDESTCTLIWEYDDLRQQGNPKINITNLMQANFTSYNEFSERQTS